MDGNWVDGWMDGWESGFKDRLQNLLFLLQYCGNIEELARIRNVQPEFPQIKFFNLQLTIITLSTPGPPCGPADRWEPAAAGGAGHPAAPPVRRPPADGERGDQPGPDPGPRGPAVQAGSVRPADTDKGATHQVRKEAIYSDPQETGLKLFWPSLYLNLSCCRLGQYLYLTSISP